MRALFSLASHLRTTVADLTQRLSAQEFRQWIEWMAVEQIGPEWDALRHAELMAALHNGALQKRDKTLFKAADFMRADPWTGKPPQQIDSPAALFSALGLEG